MKKRFKWGLALGLAIMLIVLAGCQAVGGLDVNKAVLSTLDVKSSETKSSMSLELVPADSGLTAEDKQMIDLINSISLTIDSARTQDPNTGSIEGAVKVNGKQIPFHLSVDKDNLALSLEGMTQPVVIPLNGMEGMEGLTMTGLQMSNESALKMVKDVGGFLIKHAPNPSSIALSSVTDKVNGESLSLQKLHIDIRGDELAGLVKGFLTSVSKDKEGLKEMIAAVYDVYYPIFKSTFSQSGEDMGDMAAAFGTPESVLKDKDAAVTYLTDEALKALNEFLPQYDDTVKEMMAEPDMSVILGKDTVLSLDFFLDSKLQIRKQNMDLTIQIPQGEGVPVKQVKVHSQSETWNVNQPVTVNKVDTSKGVWEPSLIGVTPGEVIRHLDAKSDLYRLLTEDAKITQKQISLTTRQDAEDDEDYWYYPEAIIVNNTTMVPIKYVAGQLDAQLKWNGATKQLTMVDDLKGTQIVIKEGSKQATIDGKAVTLTQPVINRDSTLYVPLRFVADAFGTKVNWDKSEQLVTIVRE